LQRDWLRAILHEENIGDLINRIDALVNNMWVWIEEWQQTKYSEIIQSITLVFNMYEAMKKNSMVDDKYLPFKYWMTVLLEELDKTFLYNNDERYFRRLKNKRVDLN
jgi:hypothetical protein